MTVDPTGPASEGVVRFAVARRAVALRGARLVALAGTLAAWRRALGRLGLIGRDPRRYEGYGFGNLSARLPPFGTPPGRRAFLVTGTQTGGLPDVGLDDFCVVESYSLRTNRVRAAGLCLPSSESLTHGALYDLDPRWRFVFHVHSPAIWRAASALGLPATSRDAVCGTPAMAREVRRLETSGELRGRRVFVMAGHEDGVIAFGRTADEAGGALIRCLA